jgi:hypothetical protein
MEYFVRVKPPEDEITIVKRGFSSQEEAEDHPIRMSHWKQIGVESIQPSKEDEAGRR